MENLKKLTSCYEQGCSLLEKENQGVCLVSKIEENTVTREYRCSAGYNDCPVVDSYNKRKNQ